MKKIVVLTILTSFILSCGSTKVTRESKKIIKGDWSLDTITYSESGTYNVILLNDVAKECFEGSTWHFVSNNFTGNYTINKSDCKTGSRYFRFNIQEVNAETGLYDFLLKPTDEKYKSDDYNRGFRMKLTQLSNETMQWKQSLIVADKPFTIHLNFSKKIN
ncbi:MAG: lipocalin family protein [Flavobacteriaceae bacterium]|nr:lipocalin family protein [Flavobacteriaceae bacterium]